MAIPKKRGLRQITIGEIVYYWIFQHEAPYKIKIRIGEVENLNKTILIEANYNDPWLTWNETSLKKNEIEIITPSFIRQAINFAIINHWDNQKRKLLLLEYRDESFHIQDKSRDCPILVR